MSQCMTLWDSLTSLGGLPSPLLRPCKFPEGGCSLRSAVPAVHFISPFTQFTRCDWLSMRIVSKLRSSLATDQPSRTAFRRPASLTPMLKVQSRSNETKRNLRISQRICPLPLPQFCNTRRREQRNGARGGTRTGARQRRNAGQGKPWIEPRPARGFALIPSLRNAHGRERGNGYHI